MFPTGSCLYNWSSAVDHVQRSWNLLDMGSGWQMWGERRGPEGLQVGCFQSVSCYKQLLHATLPSPQGWSVILKPWAGISPFFCVKLLTVRYSNTSKKFNQYRVYARNRSPLPEYSGKKWKESTLKKWQQPDVGFLHKQGSLSNLHWG